MVTRAVNKIKQDDVLNQGVATSGRVVREDFSEEVTWMEREDLEKGKLKDAEVGVNLGSSTKIQKQWVSKEGKGGGVWEEGRGHLIVESFGGQSKDCGLYCKVWRTPSGGFCAEKRHTFGGVSWACLLLGLWEPIMPISSRLIV